MKVKSKSLLCLLLAIVLVLPTSVSAALFVPNTEPLIVPIKPSTISIKKAVLNPAAVPKNTKDATPEPLELDGTQSGWAEKELIEAYQYGLTYGLIENNYQKPITREEFCTIAVKLYEKLSGKIAAAVSNPFTDTNNPEILKAYGIGIVKGTGANTFSPAQNITRQEICVMIMRALTAGKSGLDLSTGGSFPFDDAKQIAPWALDAMKFAYKNNIMKGTDVNKISPLNNTNREQAIVLLKRTYAGNSAADALSPVNAGKIVSPNFALNKIIPSGTGSEPGTSSKIKINADLFNKLAPRIPLLPGSGTADSDSPGFPLKSTDSNIAGVQHLGRGYNIITSKYADDQSLENYVLDIKKLLNSGRVYKIDGSSSNSRYIDGKSASSYSKQMATSVGVDGSYLFFSGSVSTNFSSSSLTEKNRSYATLLYEAPIYGLYLDDQDVNLRDYMTPAFANAVNHMEPVQLFESYGTHVLRSLRMGGRLEYNATSNSTYNSTQNSLEVDVKASFNSMFASANMSVETSQTTASTSFYSNSERNIRAYPSYGATDLDPNAFTEWFNRMLKEPGISDFGKNPLIPVWKLASSGQRIEQLEKAYESYAASKNYIQPVVTWGINGIKIQRYALGYKNVPEHQEDPVTGDDWKLVANIAAHRMLPDDELDYIYVREGWSNEADRPPVVGIFMVNETQGEDPIAIFNQMYGDDPTARLWGYAGEMLPGSGLEYYINSEGLGDKITLHYVTSLSRQPIKRLRIRHISTDSNTYFGPSYLAEDTSFLPVMDIGSHNNGNDEPQNCDEGAPAKYKYNSYVYFPVYGNCFIEYSYE